MLHRPIIPHTYPRYELDYLDTIRVDECPKCNGEGSYLATVFNPSERDSIECCDACEGSGEIRTNVTDTEEALS